MMPRWAILTRRPPSPSALPWPWQAGWFLLAHARAKGDEALAARALRVIDDNFAWGWDTGDGGAGGSGGLLYFRDVEGYSPTQLEWNM